MLGRIVHREPEKTKDADERFKEALEKFIKRTSNDDNINNDEAVPNIDSPIEEPDLMGDIVMPNEAGLWFETHNKDVSDDDTDDGIMMGDIVPDGDDWLIDEDDNDEDDDDGDGTTFLGWIEDPNGDW